MSTEEELAARIESLEAALPSLESRHEAVVLEMGRIIVRLNERIFNLEAALEAL